MRSFTRVLAATAAVLITTFSAGASASTASLVFGNNLPPYTPGYAETFYLYDLVDPSLQVARVEATMSPSAYEADWYQTLFIVYAAMDLDSVQGVTYFTNYGSIQDPFLPNFTSYSIGDPISHAAFSSSLEDCWEHFGSITLDYTVDNTPPTPPQPPLPPTPPSDVPEPESWSMVLLGLGILGAVTRRRRSNDGR
jgi:hypothetical protein